MNIEGLEVTSFWRLLSVADSPTPSSSSTFSESGSDSPTSDHIVEFPSKISTQPPPRYSFLYSPVPSPGWAAKFSGVAGSSRRGLVSKRSILAFILLNTLFLSIYTIVKTPLLDDADGSTRLSFSDDILAARRRLRIAAADLFRWEFKESEEHFEPLRKDLVLNFEEPQETLKMQMKLDVRYVTSVAFGGHANQFISIGKLLYLAKILDRVAIIPSLMPIHFTADPASFSDFFDLPRFYHESGIAAVDFAAVKPLKMLNHGPPERVSCYSSHEACTGEGNLHPHSLFAHNIAPDLWPLPSLTRGQGGHDIAFDALRLFDFDRPARQSWYENVKENLLPQNSVNYRGDRAFNIKPGFDPRGPPPDDQLLCLDNTLFLSSVMFPAPFPGAGPHDPPIPGEGLSWQEAMQHVYFTKEVESLVDKLLVDLFQVTSPSRVPPFISVHLRRTDFKEFAGFTSLAKYRAAVARVVQSVQERINDPNASRGPVRAHFRRFGIPAREFAVVATTDEPTGSPFIDEIRALGWHVLDHGALGTEGWWPTILDSAVLARGQGFVGTERSTFSHLAGLRVKYWHGGVTDIAV
ncbi:hypothetical protein RQP46_003997 [Phenoliferia psychrophenolica]